MKTAEGMRKNIEVFCCYARDDKPLLLNLIKYLYPLQQEGYIFRLANLNIRYYYRREVNFVHQLLDDVKAHFDPDVILIDASTGFTEIGAIALLDQADLGMICFSPTDQSFAGLEWVVEAAGKQRSYRGFPDLRFVVSQMPAMVQS